MRNVEVGDHVHRREERVKIAEPQKKIFFRPYRSANLPMGKRVMAAARRKEDATQLRVSALMDSSWAITGKATFIPEPINGVKKELRVVAQRRIYNCFLSAVMQSHFI